MKWKHYLMAAAACYSLQDLKNEGCRVLCVRDGYTSGTASTKGCNCVDTKESYEKFTTRSMNLGSADQPKMTEEDKKMGMVAPFRSPGTGGGKIYSTTTPKSSSGYGYRNGYEDDDVDF